MPDHAEQRTAASWLGERVRLLRQRRGWTQQQLADAARTLGPLRGAGHERYLDRSTIGKIETGLRDVSLVEVLVLAAALRVSPAALYLPSEREQRLEITNGTSITAHEALLWATGQALPFFSSNGDDSTVGFFESAFPSHLLPSPSIDFDLDELREEPAQCVNAAVSSLPDELPHLDSDATAATTVEIIESHLGARLSAKDSGDDDDREGRRAGAGDRKRHPRASQRGTWLGDWIGVTPRAPKRRIRGCA
jgi:transcriptional regulator with XRE-family HTH domain